MIKVTIHVAKTNLSKLIAQVEAGEEVVICRGEKEVVRMAPVNDDRQYDPLSPSLRENPISWGSPGTWDGASPRKPGSLEGIIAPTNIEDFAPLSDEELSEWEGGSAFPDENTSRD